MTQHTSPSPYSGTSAVAAHAPQGGVVTLVAGTSFCLSGRTGDVGTDLPHGLFLLDTRVLSRWELLVDGHRLEPLAVDVGEPNEATFVARPRPPAGHADAQLVVFRRRRIGAGLEEQVRVTNHGMEDAAFELVLATGADFADLFAVKESRVPPGGAEPCAAGPRRLGHRSTEGPVARQVDVELSEDADEVADGAATFRRALGPGETWTLDVRVGVAVAGRPVATDAGVAGGTARRMAEWRAELPVVRSDRPDLDRVVARASEDLGALRLFDPDHPDDPVVAAGAPWFMALFGRDSLLTAWMTLPADRTLARGTLRTLARLQGADVDPDREEQPGKILHEVRLGAAGAEALARGDVYFGSIDATPLFVMVVGELCRWCGPDGFLEEMLPHVDRALDWIREFGDRDGDGYVEYLRTRPDGLRNQGWKDSWDAIRHRDGSLADGPIALCEVQAYTYGAYVARAHMARETGDEATYARYRDLADDLRARFVEDFWLEDEGTVALALDGDKRPVAVPTSNAGHCLWAGILDPDRAASVAARLLADDMFSGWGIRTLGARATAYNPVSYHNGSVWPHDNALCAAGLARYGHVEEAHRVIRGQLAVARASDGRLPELFAGFDRSELGVPAAYPTSCSPQAWASAAPLLWLRSLLRLDPWATRSQIALQPDLPPWLRRLHVAGLRVGEERLSIHVEDGEVEVEGAGGLRVALTARPPLSAALDPH